MFNSVSLPAQFGIRVRDPSQMFVFGGTNRVADADPHAVGQKLSNKEDGNSLRAENLFVKTGDFGPNSSGNMFKLPNKVHQQHLVSINQVPKSESDNNAVGTPPSPYFGLRLTTQSQRPLFSKPSQTNQQKNCMTSHLVSVKTEDGQRWSTTGQQDPSVTGSCDLPSTSYAANSSRITSTSPIHLQQLDLANPNPGFIKSKKRKCSTFEHVTQGSPRLHDISTAEHEWAHSAVRLPEELIELAAEIKDSYLIGNRKRRLSLTTQLMQLLFKPPPAVVLTEDATTHCDIVAYYACKLALGDASGLCSPAGKNMTSKSSSDQDLLEVIEGFIDRSKRLEDDVSRLEKGKPLILEVMMDIQDLEKTSFINRLAMFHTRRPTVTRPRVTGDTASSSSSSVMRKLNPPRYVKAMSMPKTVPEGQNCLFL